MTDPIMPRARDFGWDLKPNSSTHFTIEQRPNGQFWVVLNHALLRGCSAEMLHWWFLHFPNLRVRLDDIEGFERQVVPGYLLWHPSDHVDATLLGNLGPDGAPRAGSSIHIREAMQYETYGWTYKVDNKLKIFYVGADGWAMGREIPLLGKVMALRIHFKDVVENGEHVGAHYHYEIVIGLSGGDPVSKAINTRITHHFSPEFFKAWHTHNAIEVGVFENFLPPLYAQRDDLSDLRYAKSMNPPLPSPASQTGFSRDLFDHRVALYRASSNPYTVQAAAQPTFI